MSAIETIEKAEAALDRAEAGVAALKGTLLRYGQHDDNCDAVQPMWHRGPCDCGWSAACKLLGIDEESAGMPTETPDGQPRYSGGRRVDIGAVVGLAGQPAAALARWLVACGYKQINRRYLAVACLPNGKTGREALRAAFNGDRDAEWIDTMSDEEAGDRFRRYYAHADGAPLVLELDRETFAAFKAAGGATI